MMKAEDNDGPGRCCHVSMRMTGLFLALAVFICRCCVNNLLHSELGAIPRSISMNHHHRRRLETTTASTTNTDSHHWNGIPVEYKTANDDTTSFTSTVHCVGENFRADAWKYRSCRFRNICVDTTTHQWVLFPSQKEQALQSRLDRLSPQARSLVSIGTTAKGKTVSLGCMLSDDTDPSKSPVLQEWFPGVIANGSEQADLLSKGFYQLPDNTVLFPFRTTTTDQLWNEMFSMYTVLSMFHMEDQRLALWNHPQEGTSAAIPQSFQELWGSNVLWLDDRKVLPVSDTRSNLVCATHGVAGLGMIGNTRTTASSSHHDTAGVLGAPVLTHLLSHAATLYQFRGHLIQRLGLDVDESIPESSTQTPLIVSIDFGTPNQLIESHLQETFSNEQISIRQINSQSMNVVQGARQAMQSNVYICAQPCAMPALFLPRGAILVVVAQDADDNDNVEHAHTASSTERDLLGSAGYLTVIRVSAASSISLSSLLTQTIADRVRPKLEN